jgi:hypothetical protein
MRISPASLAHNKTVTNSGSQNTVQQNAESRRDDEASSER